MWRASVAKWVDQPRVPYQVFQHVQTTPKVKMQIYTSLLDPAKAVEFRLLREQVIRSCEPRPDKDVLKAAWTDPDQACKDAAHERVGGMTKYVGVKG